MAKQTTPEGNFVKKETMFIVALITLVIGFLGGVFYSAMQSGPAERVQTTSAPPQQSQQQSGLTNEQPEIFCLWSRKWPPIRQMLMPGHN